MVADQLPGLLDVTDVDRFRLGHWGETGKRVSVWLGEVDFATADASGVGAPVVEGLGDNVVPVTITGGQSLTVDVDGARIGKRLLVDLLMAAIANGSVRVSATGSGAEALKRELSEFLVKPNGKLEGLGHDDTVLALALLVLAPIVRKRLTYQRTDEARA